MSYRYNEYNPIEKWSAVLEADIGDKIPTTTDALLVATSLELQMIENRFSNRVPEQALPYTQYYLPMIRWIYPIVFRYKDCYLEADYIDITVAAGDSVVKREIFTKSPTEIHETLRPIDKFNLSEFIRQYEPLTAFGKATQNLVQNKLMAAIITSLKNHTTSVWFLRTELDMEGDICVTLMGE